MQKITALVPCFNNEASICKILQSVEWADEILVVDSYSTDRTVALAAGFGARVLQHEYENSARQKNWALSQCAHPWVFQIDTDESLETGLIEEIREAVRLAPEHIHAFRLPRKNHMLGRWQRFGGNYPDYQTRLLRRDSARWQDREVHAHVCVDGEIGTLVHHILHDNMPHLARELRNLDRYTRYEADELRKRGVRFRYIDLIVRPPAVFLYRYVRQSGWRDGLRGFIYGAYAALYVFLTRAKLWEMYELNIEKSPK